MSTSPDMQKSEAIMNRSLKPKFISEPALTLIKGVAWVVVGIAALTGLIMNYELVLELLGEAGPMVLEIAESTLDTFFEKVVRLNPMFAQMATAYTGFVLVLLLLYLLVRKSIQIYQKAQTKSHEFGEVYSKAWQEWYGEIRESLLKWWESLTMVNKVVATVAFILIGIPVALLLSFVLGSLVADLL